MTQSAFSRPNHLRMVVFGLAVINAAWLFMSFAIIVHGCVREAFGSPILASFWPLVGIAIVLALTQLAFAAIIHEMPRHRKYNHE